MTNALDKNSRSKLEKTVVKARDLAETGARNALEHLGVGRAEAEPYLTEAQKAQRNRLRAHGRSLGDRREPNGRQSLEELAGECAYEHWYRMLFARFLAEAGLLIHPDHGVAVTLEDCEELAKEEGLRSRWEIAGRFAGRILPGVFRADSPALEMELSREDERSLEVLVEDLPPEVFRASDSLGWVYQFWQAKKKDEVNASEVKIGARELPAVTQLFTEPYMVSFLLDNSLGAWWAARRLQGAGSKEIAAKCPGDGLKVEEELRKKAALPGVPLDYLRFAEGEDGRWSPAGGGFEAWPEDLADFKVLDPCCGSGHFLVAVLHMLVPLRMEREGLSSREAADRVLAENIHGLEIDKRCVELAAFALAYSAWRYPGAGGYRPLPELNIACSGLPVASAREEWKALGAGNRNLRIAMDWMYDFFRDAPVLGSLLDPGKSDAAKLVAWKDLSAALDEALSREEGEDRREAEVTAQGLSRAAVLLSGRYDWVVTNVPYLARGKQEDGLKEFCEKKHSAAKNDLATVFLDRCLEFCREGGTCSVVLPQNWLFLPRYKNFREKLLRSDTWRLIARLGEGGFDSSAAAGAFTILLTISRGNRDGAADFSLSDAADVRTGSGPAMGLIYGLDVSAPRMAGEKAAGLVTAEIKRVEQARQLENPDATVIFEIRNNSYLLGDYATCNQGIGTADISRFVFRMWELHRINNNWDYYIMAPDGSIFFQGLHSALRWEKGVGVLNSSRSSRVCGQPVWGKNGIGVAVTRGIRYSIYFGKKFDCTIGILVPKNEKHLNSISSFLMDQNFPSEVRKIDQALSVTESSFLKVPFDLDRWTKVAEEKYPNGLPKPYSDDPTQWIFHGHPSGSVVWDEEKKWTAIAPPRGDASVLQVAAARLLGYRWPAELDPAMELADEARHWVEKSGELLRYADKDGIVPLQPLLGEASAADRLMELLRGACGAAVDLPALLAAAGCPDWTLAEYLRDRFFEDHCRLFHHRPFVWQIWDGHRDGFSALVNYHKLTRENLEKLIYSHLGDYTHRLEAGKKSIEDAEAKLVHARRLKEKLEAIKEGESPYDIFVRWKPLKEQPFGWDPDPNDGVRLNIRPFLTAEVLRINKPPKLNVKWEKDRGKDVESAPWYGVFKGDRINDHHTTLAEKRKARRG